MHPFHMNRLGAPSAPLDHGQHRRPIAVEQRKVVVKREGRGRVLLRRMNRQNQHKSALRVSDISSTLQAGFKQVVGSHAAV